MFMLVIFHESNLKEMLVIPISGTDLFKRNIMPYLKCYQIKNLFKKFVAKWLTIHSTFLHKSGLGVTVAKVVAKTEEHLRGSSMVYEGLVVNNFSSITEGICRIIRLGMEVL